MSYIEWAPRVGVFKYEEIATIVLELLGHPEAWISDESYLSHFTREDDAKDKLAADVFNVFNVDVSVLMDRPLVEIFKFISDNK